MPVKTKYIKYFVFICSLFLIDWLIKLIMAKLVFENEITIGVVRIGLFKNYHGLFGLVGISEIIIISFLVLALLGVLFRKAVGRNERSSLVMIFVGGVINLFDRIYLGYVPDNFAIGNLGYFNFADLMIIAGVVVYIVNTFSLNNSKFASHHS